MLHPFDPRRSWLLLAAALVTAACGSSQTSVTSPSTLTRCALTVATPTSNVPAEGAEGTVNVSASRDCTWSAAAEAPWLSITAGRSGQGDGTVTFRASANADPAARRGAVVLNDARVDIVQAAAACDISLGERAAVFGQAGGPGHLDVQASSPLCGWTAVPEAPWISLDTREGRGSARIRFDVQPSAGPARSAHITVAGQRFSITQSDGCAYHVAPAAITIPASGGSAAVRVTTTPACAWAAASSTPWITVAGPAAGSGSATVTLAATGTPGPARTGTASVAGQDVVVSQPSATLPAPSPPDPAPPGPPAPGPSCTYSISPARGSVPATGGSGTFIVETGAGCAWTASSSVSWLNVLDTAGTGPTGIRYEATANPGPPRTAVLSAGGRTVTVEQAGACAYTLSATTRHLPAEGGTSSIDVTTGSSCAWTARSGASWLTITDGASGQGNGTVRFSAATHSGAARTATLTVGEQVVTVVQAGTCTFAIAPGQASIGAPGGSLTVAVSSAEGCSWTASSTTSWIGIPQGAGGSGNGEVNIQVQPNAGADARTGTALIAGRTFTIVQAASSQPECRAEVAPDAVAVPAAGGPTQLRVTIGSSCAWTSEAGVPWIRVTAGSQSTGSGPVLLQIERNAGAARQGIVTVAGAAVRVTQEGRD